MSAYNLAGKVAIVTGSQRGIGLGIVTELAVAGAHVLLTGIADEEGKQAAEKLKARGLSVQFQHMDTTNEADVKAAVDGLIKQHDRIDIAVANAAIYPNTPIAEISVKEWDEVMTVNLRGAFTLAKCCFPHFKEKRNGRIVFLSSITGPRVSSPGYAHYATTKAGILGFMRTAALEWAPWGITLNAVEPGNILTEGVLEHQPQSFVDAQMAAVPLHRLGTPQDIGHAVRFLVSDEANYITGQTLVIDGGQTLPEMSTAVLPKA